MIQKIKSEYLGKVVIFLYNNDTVEMKRNTHCFSAKHPADVPVCMDLYKTPCRSAGQHRLLTSLRHYHAHTLLHFIAKMENVKSLTVAPWPWIHTLFCALVDKTRSSALCKFLYKNPVTEAGQ